MDRYFEDLSIGLTVESEGFEVKQNEIIDFAASWDPQPFHVDPESARDTFFGTLVASGVHTFAITMRLGVGCRVLTGNSVAGLGIDKMRFVAPVLPDSTLFASFTVAGLRPSRSKPHLGIVDWDVRTRDGTGRAVFSAVFTNLYRRRDWRQDIAIET